MRRLALRSAFSARALEQAVYVVEPLLFEAPKTKRMAALLDRMDLVGRKVLILTHGDNRNVLLSARNIPDVVGAALPGRQPVRGAARGARW